LRRAHRRRAGLAIPPRDDPVSYPRRRHRSSRPVRRRRRGAYLDGSLPLTTSFLRERRPHRVGTEDGRRRCPRPRPAPSRHVAGRGWSRPCHRCNVPALQHVLLPAVRRMGPWATVLDSGLAVRWCRHRGGVAEVSRDDDPPIGTVVLGHERVIHMGDGDEQPLADTSSA
jgi:hypothetical protein